MWEHVPQFNQIHIEIIFLNNQFLSRIKEHMGECLIMQFPVNVLASVTFSEKITGVFI